MEKSWNQTKRFLQIIKRLTRCIIADKVILTPDQFALLENNDIILGVYKGDKNFEDIVFLNNAILFFNSQTNALKKIVYSELKEVIYPLSASDSILLKLRLKNGYETNLKVVGVQGSFRDVFHIGKFFMRVIEDNQFNTLN